MILRRVGVTDIPWLAIVLIALGILLSVEPYQLPGAPERSPANDWIRWVLQLPTFCAGIGIVALGRGGLERLVLTPARWLGLFCAWQLIAALFARKPAVSVVLSMGFVACVGVGLLIARRGWPNARGILTVVLAVVTVASLLLVAVGQGGFLRTQGIMGHPNAFGGAMSLAVVIFARQLLLGRNWAAPLWLSAFALLYLSDSRTALAAAMLGCFVLLGDVWPKGALSGAFGFMVTAIILFTQTSVFGTGESLSRSGDAAELATLTGRTEIWNIAVPAIVENPIVGYGPGSTTELFAEIKPDDVLGTFEINHAHNLWLQLGLIGGVPSMLLVTFAFVGYLIRTRHVRLWDRDAIVLCLAIFGISEPVFSAEPNIFLVIAAATLGSVGVAVSDGTRRGSVVDVQAWSSGDGEQDTLELISTTGSSSRERETS